MVLPPHLVESMSKIKDALLRRNTTITLGDIVFECTRPSAIDLIEAIEFTSHSADKLSGWLVARHLVENGQPVFKDHIEALEQCDCHLLSKLAFQIESLYNEGKD